MSAHERRTQPGDTHGRALEPTGAPNESPTPPTRESGNVGLAFCGARQFSAIRRRRCLSTASAPSTSPASVLPGPPLDVDATLQPPPASSDETFERSFA